MKKYLIVSGILFLFLFSGLMKATQFDNSIRLTPGWYIYFNINIDPRINFYTENGYSLGSELCQGQKFRVTTAVPSGEWDALGEWDGSPPIAWVENISDFLEKVKMNKVSQPEMISGLYDGYMDEKVGVPVYIMPLGVANDYTNIVCELPKFTNIDVTGADALSGSTFGVTSPDRVNISFRTDVKCVYYIFAGCDVQTIENLIPSEKACFVWRNLILLKGEEFAVQPDVDKILNNMSMLKLGTISDSKSIAITKIPSQPKIGIASTLTDEQLSSQSSTYMKLTINNTGSKEVTIKDINLNVNSQLLACTSTKLLPGESTDCILYVSPKDSSLVQANVKYQYLMCGERQTKTESFPAGFIDVKPAECLNNSNCQENYICCAGKCHDSAKGICSDVNADGIPEWIGK